MLQIPPQTPLPVAMIFVASDSSIVHTINLCENRRVYGKLTSPVPVSNNPGEFWEGAKPKAGALGTRHTPLRGPRSEHNPTIYLVTEIGN